MVTCRFSRIPLLVLPLLLSGPAHAGNTGSAEGEAPKKAPTQAERDDAQRHYKRGVELFKNSVYDAALIEFRRAYEISPSYKILYNIGQVSRQLDDFASALDAYEQYLREGGSNVPAARDAEVKAELERIGQWVGKIEVVSKSAGVEITVDDVVVGRTPIRVVSVNAGRRKVTATAPGRAPLTRIIDVAGGEMARLALDSADDAASPNPVASTPAAQNAAPAQVQKTTEPMAQPQPQPLTPLSPPPPVSSPSTQRSAPWFLWGGAAVIAAGAVTTGVFALKSSSDVDELKRDANVTPSEYDKKHDQMVRFALATDVLTGLAVVVGGVALYVTLKSPSAEPSVGLTISPSGVSVVRTF